MRHRVVIRAARFRRRDEELGCDVVAGYGFRAYCICGYMSPVRRTVRLARVEGATHRTVAV